MLPVDLSIVGTVHSHPVYSSIPSKADLNLFSKKGRIHIIVAMPFNSNSWKAYNSNGEIVQMKVV
jgi:proteasome lid subunit RPN8/RPN11